MAPPLQRDALERGAAWLYTGPLGHLYSALADIGAMWVRFAGARIRKRLRQAPAER